MEETTQLILDKLKILDSKIANLEQQKQQLQSLLEIEKDKNSQLEKQLLEKIEQTQIRLTGENEVSSLELNTEIFENKHKLDIKHDLSKFIKEINDCIKVLESKNAN